MLTAEQTEDTEQTFLKASAAQQQSYLEELPLCFPCPPWLTSVDKNQLDRTATRPPPRTQLTMPVASRTNSIDWPRSLPSVTTARSGPKNAIGMTGRGSPVFGVFCTISFAPSKRNHTACTR